MKKIILHKANTRRYEDHGWLKTFHTFSFANYYNPERLHFGALRVINDDTIEGGMGFDMHPHDNMEIITIPLEGDLQHKDSMGNSSIIRTGDIQVMSAGTGVFHSEYNYNKDKPIKLLQIWVSPNKKNAKPRYHQLTLREGDRHNKLQQVLSPHKNDAGVWIHQDAWFHMGKFDKGFNADYEIKFIGHGIYVFVISGDITINEEKLNARDGLGLLFTNTIHIEAQSDAEFLIIEVPIEL